MKEDVDEQSEVDEVDVARAWNAEIERRVREVFNGTAVLEEWSVVRARLADRRMRMLASNEE